jgi:hypothetical protein
MKLSVLLVALSVGAPVCSANLITNGDFETNPVVNFAVLASGDTTSLPGWKVIGTACTANCLLVLNSSNYTEPSNIGTIIFQAQSGNQSIDITGGGNTGDGGIEQTVATTIGTQYSLTFFLGNMDNAASNYPNASSALVRITGQSDQTFTNNLNTANHINWAPITYTFTATSLLTTIDFINATPGTDNEAGIDNVQLNEVTRGAPEPATWSMLGIFGVGLLYRRLRSRSV